jgi:hypothetical protein
MPEANMRRSIIPPTLRAGEAPQSGPRLYERVPSSLSEQGRAVIQLLAPFRAKPFALQPRTRDIERLVTAAFADIGKKHSRTCVIPIARLKESYADLPYSMREAAKAGLRDSLAEAMNIPLRVILEQATGWKPEPEVIGKSAAKDGLFERLPEQIDDATGGFVPANLLDCLTMTLTYHVVAIAKSDPEAIRQIAPFTELFRSGNVPLGILKSDNSFVVIAQ